MYMRKIMVALPCLLFCGFVFAKEAPARDAQRGADGLLMAKAFNANDAVERPVVGKGSTLEAAKKQSTKTAAKAAPAPAAQPSDTSKRFNMTQNGKRMTADDFDAWMKKNGYRVATGAPGANKEEPQKGAKK